MTTLAYPALEWPALFGNLAEALNAVRVRTSQPGALRNQLARAGLAVRSCADGELVVAGGSLEEIGDLAFQYRVPIYELSTFADDHDQPDATIRKREFL